MVVDTELIRVNFVREESRGTVARRREKIGGSLAVQRLRPIVILAPAPGVTFVASTESPYSSLCFSLRPPLHPLPSVGRASAFRPFPLSPHQRLGVT